MKIVFVGNGDECLGFSLVGLETAEVNSEKEFKERMKKLLNNSEVGILVIADRFAGTFVREFGETLKRKAKPAVVFVPSIDGVHYRKSLKEFLYRVLGV